MHQSAGDGDMPSMARRSVIIQPSNGLLYVIEAATGKLISGDPFW
jgi:hypothetical protein